MSKDIEKLRKVNLGALDTFELERLKTMVQHELTFRKENPEKLVKLLYLDDGSEGFYCPIDKFSSINPKLFFKFVSDTISQGSSFTISEVEMSEEDARNELERYGWFPELTDDDDDCYDETLLKLR